MAEAQAVQQPAAPVAAPVAQDLPLTIEERMLRVIAPATDKPRDEKGKFASTKPAEQEPVEPPQQGQDTVPGAEGEDTQAGAAEPEAEVEAAPSWEEIKEAKIKIPMKRGEEEWEEEVTLQELRDGRLMQKDYQQKTQELAKQRREAQEKAQALIEQQRTEYLGALEQLQQTVILSAAPELRNVDWTKLAKDDPAEYVRLSARAREVQEALQQVGAQRQKVSAQQTEERRKALEKAVNEAKEKIQEAIPNWNDDLYQSLLKRSVESYGFTAQEAGQIYDPRAIQILHDAHQYRLMKEQKPKVEQKVQNVPKVLKPGAATAISNRGVQEYSAAKAQLKKSGKVDDLAAFFRASLKRK
jgi:hypothetical protein